MDIYVYVYIYNYILGKGIDSYEDYKKNNFFISIWINLL